MRTACRYLQANRRLAAYMHVRYNCARIHEDGVRHWLREAVDIHQMFTCRFPGQVTLNPAGSHVIYTINNDMSLAHASNARIILTTFASSFDLLLGHHIQHRILMHVMLEAASTVQCSMPTAFISGCPLSVHLLVLIMQLAYASGNQRACFYTPRRLLKWTHADFNW